jgi:class 3 adenylate cyclase
MEVDVGAWLRGLGLGQYEQAFRDNDIDAEVLSRLSADDLIAIGVSSVGHRRRLLDAIATLSGAPKPARKEAPVFEPAPEPAAQRAAEAERRQLTIMFVDLVGSTELSRQLDPEAMREIIHAYQNVVAGGIARFEGHVAKFMGDGVLAYFGWPRAHEDEAERAVRAGLAITAAVAGLGTPVDRPLTVRIGIATGLVVVGDLIGEGPAQEEAVIGETPNLAARLQEAAGPGGVIVADSTRRLLGEVFELGKPGAMRLKGFADPVWGFPVLGERPAQSRFEAHQPRGLLPMVGRDQELALLLERWRQAAAGEGQAVLLVGEAGIGKSRLVRATLDVLAGHGHVTLRYQCSPHHTSSPLWPVVQQLGLAAGLAPGDPEPDKLDKLEALLRQAVEDPRRGGAAARSAAGDRSGRALPGAGPHHAGAAHPHPGRSRRAIARARAPTPGAHGSRMRTGSTRPPSSSSVRRSTGSQTLGCSCSSRADRTTSRPSAGTRTSRASR